jgi:hypothetical protein
VSGPNASRPDRRSTPRERAPAFTRTAVELSEHVALMGAERVAEVLRLRVGDLEPLLAGRAKPSAVGLQRLRMLVRRSRH